MVGKYPTVSDFSDNNQDGFKSFIDNPKLFGAELSCIAILIPSGEWKPILNSYLRFSTLSSLVILFWDPANDCSFNYLDSLVTGTLRLIYLLLT